ncbi:hypothetical protein CR513_22811, partial [Mucuna pruriens]
MEKEDKHSQVEPLIIPYSTTTSSYSLHNNDQHHDHDAIENAKHYSDNNIVFRILLVLLVALISIWANYEASKTFDITIVNDAEDSPAGRRFALSYVSNDKATRILLNTSSFVQHLLYPNNNNNYNNNNRYPKKHVDSVTLLLPRRNLNATVAVYAVGNRRHGGGKFLNSYVIEISPMLLEDKMYDKMAIVGAVLRGMAKVWLWDGAPPGLVDGMAEYVAEMAGFRRDTVAYGGYLPECEEGRGGWWWEDRDPTHVARLLHYCEKFKKGFIQRLNGAMRDTWHDHMADEVLGVPVVKLCDLYDNNSSWVGSISM